MGSIRSLWLAGISLALAFLPPATMAARHPRVGGTLRVDLRAPAISLDPREWKTGSLSASADEKVAALVFDRLITLDDYGRFQPALAVDWSHDAALKNWQFKLRPGVKFSDGTSLTPPDVAAALQPLLPAAWQATANENSVTIRAARPAPDLLEILASGRYFIYRERADGTLLGTGPFFLAENRPAAPSEVNPSAIKPAHLKFRANEECWAGRPFLDAVEITLGEPPLRQLLDLQVGRVDVTELSADLVRRAQQENLRVWSSAPVVLLALRFDAAQAASADDHLREALALSMDRETMANVLLQREAQPASALLPQWLSGYAFLLESRTDPARAKEIRASLPANEAGTAEPLRLRVDAVGDLMKLLGERVAVNARQANLSVQLVPHTSSPALPGVTPVATPPVVGLHLFAWHYDSLSPREELEALVKHLEFVEAPEIPASSNSAEQLYAQERHLLDERRVVPLLALPEYTGLGASVRNWAAARWGEWRLADVWLDATDDALARPTQTNGRKNSRVAVPAGARP